jgi:hypothetical protein
MREGAVGLPVNRDGIQRLIGARNDFHGLRRVKDPAGNEVGMLVMTCACGCGGHVLIKATDFENVAAYTLDFAARMKTAQRAPAIGTAVYVKGHEPLGIAAEQVRCGMRTQLRAST